MFGAFTWIYHHIFKATWFYNQLDKNIKHILKDHNLSNQEKGNQIYNNVFWQTWHQCNEPRLYSDPASLIDVCNHFRDVLNKLHYTRPTKNEWIINDFERSTKHDKPVMVNGIAVGCANDDVHYVNLNINVWHFGNTPNLQGCINKAFK